MTAPTSAPAEPSIFRGHMGPALLVFALSIGLTLAVWQMTSLEHAKLRLARFDARVQTVQEAIEARMLAYGQILLGGVGLVNTLGGVGRDQWAAYVNSLSAHQNYPGVHGIGFAELVAHEKRSEFVKLMQSQGLPQFDIRPSGIRDFYVPVTYLEPRTDRNLRAVGFDMLMEPTRRAAIMTAAETAKMAMTGRLKLASEPNVSPVFGFLIYAPVYHPRMPLETPTQRREAIKGFVNSPFRMDDLMSGILDPKQDPVDVRIYDGKTPGEDTLLYTAQPDAPAATSEKRLIKTSQLDLLNRSWTVEFSMPASMGTPDSNTPLFVLVAGTLISLLVSALTFTIAMRVRTIRHSEQHYIQLANFDLLTGLPNRAKLHERLSHTLEQARRTHQKFALIFIDLDNFKAVNDQYGHESGDLLLNEVAKRLSRCIRKADMVARLGGDEFVVILHEVKDKKDAGTAAQNLLDALSKPVQLADSAYDVSVSMGISIYPVDAESGDELLKRADRAMYASKSLGRNRFYFFAPELLSLSYDTSPSPLDRPA